MPVVKPTATVANENKLFAYGTLNVHAIQAMVWDEQKSGVPMVLHDYELKMFSNYIFYLERRLGENVSGKLYTLTDEQLKATDTYETDSYERVKVTQNGTDVFIYVRKVVKA